MSSKVGRRLQFAEEEDVAGAPSSSSQRNPLPPIGLINRNNTEKSKSMSSLPLPFEPLVDPLPIKTPISSLPLPFGNDDSVTTQPSVSTPKKKEVIPTPDIPLPSAARFSPKRTPHKICPPSPSPMKSASHPASAFRGMRHFSADYIVRPKDKIEPIAPSGFVVPPLPTLMVSNPYDDIRYLYNSEQSYTPPSSPPHVANPTIATPSSALRVPATINTNPFSPSRPKKRTKLTHRSESVSLMLEAAGSEVAGMNDEPPTSSRYQLDFQQNEQIGDGSFGNVYRCINRIDGMEYAIKTFKKPITSESQKRQQLKEVYALAAVTHPNLIRYYSAWIENDKDMFIQTEYCDGGSLDFIKQRKTEANRNFKEAEIIEIIKQMSSALEYIHNRNMVHLDIKPANIYYTKQGQYKLGDFGLMDAADKANIEEGDGKYVPRELLALGSGKNKGTLQKADIFSLGISVLELMRSSALPSGDEEWTEIRNLNFELPEGFNKSIEALIKKMMDPNPSMRPSATEILRDPLMLSPSERAFKERIRALEELLKVNNIPVPSPSSTK